MTCRNLECDKVCCILQEGAEYLCSVCALVSPSSPRISEVSQAPPPPGAHPQLMLSSFFPLSFCFYLNPKMNVLMLLSLRESFSRVSSWQDRCHRACHRTYQLLPNRSLKLLYCGAFLPVPHKTSCHPTPSVTRAACGPAHGCSCNRVRFGLSFSYSY